MRNLFPTLSKQIGIMIFVLVFQMISHAETYLLQSPDETIQLTNDIKENIHFSVIKNNQMLLNPSLAGKA